MVLFVVCSVLFFRDGPVDSYRLFLCCRGNDCRLLQHHFLRVPNVSVVSVAVKLFRGLPVLRLAQTMHFGVACPSVQVSISRIAVKKDPMRSQFAPTSQRVAIFLFRSSSILALQCRDKTL